MTRTDQESMLKVMKEQLRWRDGDVATISAMADIYEEMGDEEKASVRCETCQGHGRVYFQNPHAVGSNVCPICEGFGITHCCEGDQAQACPPDASPAQSTTSDLPIDPHAPTS